jgi:hypothetical protein
MLKVQASLFITAVVVASVHSAESSNSEPHLENARLRSENARLRAQLENCQSSPVVELVTTKTADGTNSKKKCSDHCRGDCSIDPSQVDKDCVATKRFLASAARKIVSVGTTTHPKWNLYNTRPDNPNYPARVIGTVECPCTASNGTPMDAPTALTHILGQMGAMGLDFGVAKRVAKKAKDWKGDTEKGAGYVSSLGYTAVLMINCWQKTCAPKAPALNGELWLTSLLEDGDTNKVDFGGGAYC